MRTTTFIIVVKTKRDDKEDDEEERESNGVRTLSRVEKKERFITLPDAFSPKNSQYVKYHKEEAKISSSLERTERDQKHEKERERAFLFFYAFSYPKLLCRTCLLFLQLRTLLRALLR